mmetsp:Transcript_78932/g.239435  ORF Transcript_78932/g.239435 Transcript_78932/m.239435 type:complete len:205 (-) Transcript_78932:174-788(-)
MNVPTNSATRRSWSCTGFSQRCFSESSRANSRWRVPLKMPAASTEPKKGTRSQRTKAPAEGCALPAKLLRLIPKPTAGLKPPWWCLPHATAEQATVAPMAAPKYWFGASREVPVESTVLQRAMVNTTSRTNEVPGPPAGVLAQSRQKPSLSLMARAMNPATTPARSCAATARRAKEGLIFSRPLRRTAKTTAGLNMPPDTDTNV